MFKKKAMFFKTVCLLMVFFMLSTMNIFATDTEIEFEQKDVTKAALLQGLGIITEKPEVFLSRTQLTRGEFAEIAVKLSALYDDIDSKEKMYFIDVEDSHPKSKAIYAAVNIGLMKGNGDYTFAPDRAVSYEELTKILVEIVGYKWLAELNGGYVSGYLNTANKIGLLDGVSVDNMNGMSIAKMLYNALFVEYPIVAGIGDSVTYETEPERTYMTEVLKVKEVTGIVEATEETELYGESSLGKNEIKVNGIIFRGNKLASDLLGKKVDVYYKADRDSALAKEIIYIGVSDKCSVLELTSDDVEYADGVFTYYGDSNKAKTARISDAAAIIYNGTAIDDPAFDMSSLEPENGNVVLIENDGDKVYDVVIVRNYYNIKIESISVVDDKIYDGSLRRRDLVIDNMDNWHFFNKDGGAISFEDLPVGSLVSVEENSKGGNVYVGQDLILGAVEKAYEDRLVIGGAEYFFCDDLSEMQVKMPVAGDYGRFLRDRMGKIAYFDSMSDSMMTGLLLSAGKERGADGKFKVNIYTIFSQSQVFELAAKVKIDGQTFRTDAGVFSKEADAIINHLRLGAAKENPALTNELPLAQVVRYKTDDAGNICELDTTVMNEKYEDENSLKITLPYEEGKNVFYKKRGMSFDGKVVLDGNSLVFIVNTPLGGKLDDNFQLVSGGYFSDNMYKDVSALNFVKDKIVADVMLVYQDTSERELVGEAYEMVIDETGYMCNDEGEIFETISGYHLGNYVTHKLSPDLGLERKLQQGDLIRFSLNNRDEIFVVKMIYYGPENCMAFDANNDGVADVSNGKKPDAGDYMTMAYPYHLYENAITLAPTTTVETVEDVADMRSFRVDEAKVYIFDRNNKKNPVSVGSLNDVRTYRKDGNAASKVVVRGLYLSIQTILIIK